MINDRKGLTSFEAEKLFKKYGPNKISNHKKVPALKLFVVQYTNLLVAILFLAALFAYFINEIVDSTIIFLILVFNGIFGFIQEYRAEKTLEKLQGLTVPLTRVVRDGQEVEIKAQGVVPQDIVVLREGDRIPADGRLLTKIPLEVDESILTGESFPVDKKHNDELFAGTYLVQGRGYMLVEKTGFETKLGEIAKEIVKAEKPKTPLSESLDFLGKRLSIIALIFSLLLIPIGIFQAREFKELILTSVSIAVAVIPEGLPLVITIALAVGAYKMAKAKTIVRKMAAIETLGATTVILSDKTGTITQNRMRVKKMWLISENKFDYLIRGAILGNTASLSVEENGKTEVIGDKTDGAFLLFAHEKKREFEEFRQEGRVTNEKPFDAIKKTIEVEWSSEDEEIKFVRGAPESVFKMVSEEDRKKAEKEFKNMASKGLRVIAFAYKETKDKKYFLSGLLGIYDPPRDEAKDAIKRAQKAGIKVIMVTGDNADTAFHIGEDIGLVSKKDDVMTHDEIEKLNDEELTELLDKIKIFARMMPKDKLRLVNLYKTKGEIVAVTGDGVNDALALSESHIGVAMGREGTDVAKEASDIVITDDNLFTVTRAVEEGRAIFKNITKVVIFLFSSNSAEFMLIFAGIIFGLPIPLTPTQILWVNLVSDGMPALALSTDNRNGNLLSSKPRNVSEPILNKERLRFIAVLGLPLVIFLFVFYVILLRFFPVELSRFVVFNALVFLEMVIVFVVRGGIRPISKFLFLSIGVTIIIQAVIMINPFFRGLLF